MKPNPIDRLMSMLYLDSKLDLVEIASIFKVSKQRVHERLTRYGVKMRKTGNYLHSKYPAWQIHLLNHLLSSIHYYVAVGRGNDANSHRMGKRIFRIEQLESIWNEFTKLIIVDARSKGATLNDLAAIFNTSKSTIGVKMHRMRKKGYNAPKRVSRARAKTRAEASLSQTSL